MNSEQTKENQGNSQIPNDWSPISARVKRKSSEPLSEEQEAEFRKMFEEDLMGGNSPKSDVSASSEINRGHTVQTCQWQTTKGILGRLPPNIPDRSKARRP